MSGHAEHQRPVPGRRVNWLELFFDLVMVASIGQIADTMHGDPGWARTGAFFLLLTAVWWAWVNASVTMNLFGARVTPSIWIAVTVAMAGLGIMAVAVPEALTDRAAAFALGNAVLRLVWMVPWFSNRRMLGMPWWQPFAYNLAPVVLWLASIAVAPPWQVLMWLVAVAWEVALLANIGARNPERMRNALDIDHLRERVDLLVVIVFGESILSIIAPFDTHWNPPAWLAGILGLVAVAMLAWTYFGYASEAVERGLHTLQNRGSVAGLRDTIMYLPFLLVAGIVLFAAGIGTAVTDAGHPLPVSAAACVAAGVSLFYVASVAESLRYGTGWRDMVLWGPAGILLPWAILPVSVVLPAEITMIVVVVLLGILVALSDINNRRVKASREADAVSQRLTTPHA